MSADRRIKDHSSKSTVKDDDDDYSIFMEHRQESIANIEMYRPSPLYSGTIAVSATRTPQIPQQQQTITSSNKPKKRRPTKKELREYKEKKREKSIKKESWLHED